MKNMKMKMTKNMNMKMTKNINGIFYKIFNENIFIKYRLGSSLLFKSSGSNNYIE